jgi:hypothetical protein
MAWKRILVQYWNWRDYFQRKKTVGNIYTAYAGQMDLYAPGAKGRMHGRHKEVCIFANHVDNKFL